MSIPGQKSEGKIPKTAMVLAAGFGERMRPLTDDKPKAMVEILGKPLIGHTLDWLAELNLEKIVINTHYKPAPLKAYLGAHPLKDKIVFSDEEGEILDTGGGVKKALPQLGTAPFFVANCDAFFTPKNPNPFQTLMGAFTGDGACLLLEEPERALGYAGKGDFVMGEDGSLNRAEAHPGPAKVFTGLQILDPALFEGFSETVFSLNIIYDRAIAASILKGVMSPAPWHHIGTPEAVSETEAPILGRS